METMQKLINDACEELDDWMKENPGCKEPHDTIFEIADSNTPSDTWSIMELALHDYDISGSEPELGPAFDGRPTPLNLAAANIFEKIEEGLWEYYHEHEDDYLEEEEDNEEEIQDG